MWKFTAKYENWNGEQREKVLRFNLTPSEIRKLQFSKEGGIDKYYQKIIDENDTAAIYNTFEELVRVSYGVISDDGEEFIKSEEAYNKFKNSLAYEAFMDYIITSENGATNFITGILPQNYVNKIKSPEGKKIAAEHGIDISPLTNG